MEKKTKKFNIGVSFAFFLLGALFVLSDDASITANVVGASGGSDSLTSIIGILIIVGSIGLFIASMNHADHDTINLERHMRQSNHHEHIIQSEPEESEEDKE